ncbi:MAG: complex I subunit 5 family protein [Zoogloeaceae bacterium]|nr:complex I subunit 5 family protein [Zoogloeaceae bacterium]
MNLLVAVLTPVLLALAWCMPAWRRMACALAPWAALPALLLALTGEQAPLRLGTVLLGTVLALDATGRVFLTFTALLWLAGGIHAAGHLADDARRERFFLLWLATLTGNVGLILAQDVASFYLFFALMTFAAYGLVIHDGSDASRRAGRVYLTMAVLGEGLIVAGLVMAASLTTTPLAPLLADLPPAIAAAEGPAPVLACLIAGFGIKAGLPLLHMWLPLAHPVAPIPASAVLSGAMIKAGLLGWMATLPLGLAPLEAWGTVLMLTGLLAAFGGALVGVQQGTPKTVLAYSSISQMGFITLAVGAALHSPALWPVLAPVVALYALHHGLAKGALFLAAGLEPRFGRAQWLLVALPGLSLAGLGASGMAAKLALKDALHGAGSAWWSGLPLLLGCAAVGTTLLVARYLWLLVHKTHRGTASAAEWCGWGLALAAGSLAVLLPVGLLWGESWPGRWPQSGADMFGLLWPVALGGALSLFAAGRLRAVSVPAGDVVVPVETGMRHLRTTGRRLRNHVESGLTALNRALGNRVLHAARDKGVSARLDRAFRRDAALWLVGLVMVLIVLLQ